MKGLPPGFRFHDLRHYYDSLLIASGADVKVVQARMRHASGKVTIDVYGHLWARLRRQHAGRRRQGVAARGEFCGLSAD